MAFDEFEVENLRCFDISYDQPETKVIFQTHAADQGDAEKKVRNHLEEPIHFSTEGLPTSSKTHSEVLGICMLHAQVTVDEVAVPLGWAEARLRLITLAAADEVYPYHIIEKK